MQDGQLRKEEASMKKVHLGSASVEVKPNVLQTLFVSIIRVAQEYFSAFNQQESFKS
jgi:hypothetical protein